MGSPLSARQRPLAPQPTGQSNPLVPPPPQRPLSAPQAAQVSAFAPPPLAVQMTGYQPSPGQTGPSLHELGLMRLPHQQQPYLPHQTGYGMHGNLTQAGLPQPNHQTPLMTGYVAPMTMNPTGAGLGFASGYAPAQHMSPQSMLPMMTGGINSYLAPALEPQRTGMTVSQPMSAGVHHISGSSQMAPLQPQQTGPPPDLRFGIIPESKPLMSQATGRRANLAQASMFLSCFHTSVLDCGHPSFLFLQAVIFCNAQLTRRPIPQHLTIHSAFELRAPPVARDRLLTLPDRIQSFIVCGGMLSSRTIQS